MQLTIYSFRPLFPDKIFSLTFSKILDISLTVVKFPDISRFSRQVVMLYIALIIIPSLATFNTAVLFEKWPQKCVAYSIKKATYATILRFCDTFFGWTVLQCKPCHFLQSKTLIFYFGLSVSLQPFY